MDNNIPFINTNYTFEVKEDLNQITRIMRLLDEKYQRMIGGLASQTLHLRCKNDDQFNEWVATWKSLAGELLA